MPAATKRRWSLPRRSPGSIEVVLAAVLGVLAVGTLVGAGVADKVLDTENQVTWLANKQGQVTSINPDTGRPVDRLQLGQPGTPLTVTQGNGKLIVTDPRSGKVSVVDLSMLTVGGTRNGTAGAVKVLLAGGHIVLVDRVAGTVEQLDSLTAATIGTPYRSPTPLADTTAGGDGLVWTITTDGTLTALRWSDRDASFVEQSRRAVPGAGAQTVLVGHPQGVTALDPASRNVVRAGTDRDGSLPAPAVRAPLLAAESSPRGLVAAAAPADSSLLLALDDKVTTVDTATLGCARPARPVVYHDRIYFPCTGDGKVVVLDPNGRRAKPDIITPAGGEPLLVLNADLLFVNVPGANNGLLIDPSGAVHPIQTNDPQVPAREPGPLPGSLPSTPPVPSLPTSSGGTGVTQPGGGGSTGGRPTTGPGGTGGRPTNGPGGPGRTPTPSATTPRPTPKPSPTPPPASQFTPTGATAQARPDSTILVAWTPPPSRPDSYRILRADTRQPVAAAAPGATSAIVTGVPLGQPTAFIVDAVTPAGEFPSAPSAPVAAFGRPGGASNVDVRVVANPLANAMTVEVRFDRPPDGGSPLTTYDLTVSGALNGNPRQFQDIPIAQIPYRFDITCAQGLCLFGGPLTMSVTVSNAAGAGPPVAVTADLAGPPAFTYDSFVQIVGIAGRCLDGNALEMVTCNGSAQQTWQVRADGTIRVVGRCLATNGGLHLASSCDRARPQRWDHINVQGNTMNLVDQSARMCLAVIGGSLAEFARVSIEPCTVTGGQGWTLFMPRGSVQ